MKVHYSSKTNEWATPQELFNYLDSVYDFTLDPCATKENAKCDRYFTMEDDGLTQSWGNETVFVNPPYGREIKHWIEKSYKESLTGAKVVMLIPARTDTVYWHDLIFGKASEIIFIKGRLKFGDGKGSAPFPSAIITYGTDKQGMYTLENKGLQYNIYSL